MSTIRRRSILSVAILVALAALACLPSTQPPPSPISTTQPDPTPIPKHTPPPTPSPTPEPPPAVSSGPFRRVALLDEAIPGVFKAFITTADGVLWVATDQAVGRISATTLEPYLPELGGQLAGIDASGRVWVTNADASGISAWDGATWAAFGAESGWIPLATSPFPYVRGGQSDAAGRLWFATSQDVRFFDGERWTAVTPAEMGMEAPDRDDLWAEFGVTPLADGTVWVTECTWGGPGPFGGQGVRWYQDGAWRAAASPLASGCARTLAADSAGRVWAGLNGTLWRYDPGAGSWLDLAAPESPVADTRFGFVATLAVSPDGSGWPAFELCGGASCLGSTVLYRIREGQWAQIGAVPELGSSSWGPVFDAAGSAWLGLPGGVYRVEGTDAIMASPLEAAAGAADGDGRVWIVAPHEGRDALWLLDETAMNEPAAEGFAIYLPAEQITAAAILDAELSSLQLASEPILATADITAYLSDTHELELAPAARERIARLQVPTSGIPFVVCVDRHPIYAGAFWASYSSLSFHGVVLDTLWAQMEGQPVQLQLGYPASQFFEGEDHRSDPRILQALERAGKLQ